MNNPVIIACPKCGWEPDGNSHWECACGHEWNTFDTKAKCPKCGQQWQDTQCLGCGKVSKHEKWYTSEVAQAEATAVGRIELYRRKEIIENKLLAYGIKDQKISHLPYLEFSEEDFQTPYEVGCRILILWAVSYLATNLEEKDAIESWLKSTVLWDKVTEEERKLFTEELPQKTLIGFSWRVEAVIVLCWALNLLEDLPNLDDELSEPELEILLDKLPLDEDPDYFLSTISYRSKEDIFIENMVNEMLTGYFRDIYFSGAKDNSKINRAISFERHFALNWVRQFREISDWDETDTST